MISAKAKRVVLVTCKSLAEARRIARAVVESRAAACVSVVCAPVESVYRWKGDVEASREFLLLIKTTKTRLGALEKLVRQLHSYDVPEFIALPVSGGSQAYLRWLEQSVSPALKKSPRAGD